MPSLVGLKVIIATDRECVCVYIDTKIGDDNDDDDDDHNGGIGGYGNYDIHHHDMTDIMITHH